MTALVFFAEQRVTLPAERIPSAAGTISGASMPREIIIMKRLAFFLSAAMLLASALSVSPKAAPKASASPVVRTDRDVVTLVNATMEAFVRAVHDKSMESFAPSFIAFDNRSQTLESAYSVFYPLAAAFAPVGSSAPVVLQMPSPDGRGRLAVQGYYAASTSSISRWNSCARKTS